MCGISTGVWSFPLVRRSGNGFDQGCSFLPVSSKVVGHGGTSFSGGSAGLCPRATGVLSSNGSQVRYAASVPGELGPACSGLPWCLCASMHMLRLSLSTAQGCPRALSTPSSQCVTQDPGVSFSTLLTSLLCSQAAVPSGPPGRVHARDCPALEEADQQRELVPLPGHRSPGIPPGRFQAQAFQISADLFLRGAPLPDLYLLSSTPSGRAGQLAPVSSPQVLLLALCGAQGASGSAGTQC